MKREQPFYLETPTGDQAKRLDSARAAACTPALVNQDGGTADFFGHYGKYSASLFRCSCPDFRRQRKPCKHMYRLALEMGLIDGPFLSYLHGGYSWKQAIEAVEAFPDDVQKEFLDHFRASCAGPAPYRRKKTPEMDALINGGVLVEYPEKETPKFKTVRLIEDFMVDKQKVKTYFSRKFYPPTYFNGVEMVPEDLPDDEITAFLRERGF